MIKNFTMHLSIYLFKLLLAIILATFQSCFLNKGAQQNLSKQIPNYTVTLKSENQTGYFEDKRIPIHILFTSEDEHIKNNGMGFRIKKIFIEGISGHLETEKEARLEEESDFFYQDEGYPLFFVPAFDKDNGHCELSLETLLIDKYGHEAPASTHKVASYQLYICHKQAIEAPIQEEEKSIQEEKDAKAFSATLRPLSEDYFSHKESKWELNITSDLDDNEPYKIIELQLEQGVFKLDGSELKVGDEFWLGHQELVFVPNGFVGKFAPTIVIQNSQLQTTAVSLKDKNCLFQDSGFFAKAVCDEMIALTVGGKHVSKDEAWIVEDWHFEGGVTGNLYDASSSHQRLSKLKAGTTYINCSPAIENLSGRPIVVLAIVHPDGRKETIQVAISSIVLSILEAKLTEYKTLLSDLIYPKTDPDIREKIIKASKQIVVQMGYLLEVEKTKIASIVKDYESFLEENQARFDEAMHASEILSLANSAIRNSFVLADKDKNPFWRSDDKKWIAEFVNEVDNKPELFTHIPITIQTIREHLYNIDASFCEEE